MYLVLYWLSEGLAVDWITNKLYFTDVDLAIVGVLDAENFHYRVLIQLDPSVNEPHDIVLDPNNRYQTASSKTSYERCITTFFVQTI